MTDLVPVDEIERLVGAFRHDTVHLGRADTRTNKVYILHPRTCLLRYDDLRTCWFSLALDRGVDTVPWYMSRDRTVILWVDDQGRLIPLRNELTGSTVALMKAR